MPSPCKAVVWFLFPLGLLFLLSCSSGKLSGSNPPQGPPGAITLQPLVSGLVSPLDLESAPDSSGRLFVVEQGGTIRVIQNGSLMPVPYLDISSKVLNTNESGLLGLTFHPSFAQNGKLYIYYVRSNAGQVQSVFSELTATPAANQVDPATERILLVVNQVGNFTNHKAGQLAFGPDGFLYFGLGDGGSEGDPFNNGQNTQTLLGKIMRIDVNSTTAALPYGIPADNPFVNGGGLPEIYAVGFRNPFHFSFDRQTGRLFVGDVGQDRFEEVDIVQKGGNYGWSVMEGAHCFKPMNACNTAGLALPIVEIAHPEAEAVMGGFVYHGTALKNFQGLYVFGDLNGKLWALTENPANTFTRTTLMDAGFSISSFGQDSAGELYVVDISGGRILKIVPM